MTRKTHISALIITAALALSGLPAQGACLSNNDIQNAIGSGQILSFNEIVARAGLSGVLSFKVCDRGGQWYYEVTVDEGSQVRKVLLNAKTGRP